jgi:hypothetical protein
MVNTLQHTSWMRSLAALVRHLSMRLVAAFEATRNRQGLERVIAQSWVPKPVHAPLVSLLASQDIVHGRFMHKHAKMILGHRHSLIGVKVENKEAGTCRIDFLLECGVDRDALRRLCLVAKDAHVSLCVLQVGPWLADYVFAGSADFDVARVHLDAVLNTGHRVRVISPQAYRLLTGVAGYDHLFIEVCTAQGLRMGIVPSDWHMLTHLF